MGAVQTVHASVSRDLAYASAPDTDRHTHSGSASRSQCPLPTAHTQYENMAVYVLTQALGAHCTGGSKVSVRTILASDEGFRWRLQYYD